MRAHATSSSAEARLYAARMSTTVSREPGSAPDTTVRWRALVRDVPNFPKPGILFRDLTPLLADGPAFTGIIADLARRVQRLDAQVIVGIEARGFIFGAAVAAHLGLGFVPIRKPGKLPYRTRARRYDLEYGHDAVEMHEDALIAGARVALVDDVLATGGTMAAAVHLVRELGAKVAGTIFVIELAGLNGRARLADTDVEAVLTYE